MSKGMKFGILGVAVLALAGVIAVTAARKNKQPTEVRIEAVQKRDLVASVTASGQVSPHGCGTRKWTTHVPRSPARAV